MRRVRQHTHPLKIKGGGGAAQSTTRANLFKSETFAEPVDNKSFKEELRRRSEPCEGIAERGKKHEERVGFQIRGLFFFPLQPSGQCLSFRLGHSDIYILGDF